MLSRISIKNLAIISSAELDLAGGLNVLSGETGAGKSIVVDALMLLMGGRFDKTMLKYGENCGSVEGFFTSDGRLEKILSDNGIDAGDEVLVRRKFYADGKNDVRINGTAVTASMLKSIMSTVIDICGQNEYQIIAKKREHRIILDDYAGENIRGILNEISDGLKKLKEIDEQIAAIGDSSSRLIRLDMLGYQIDEIEKAKVYPGEDEELIEKRARIMHAEKIRNAIASSSDALDSEGGALDALSQAIKSLISIRSLGSDYESLLSRLESLSIELSDVSGTIQDLEKEIGGSEEELDDLEKRLRVVRNVKSKYGPLDGLQDKLAELKKEFDFLSSADEEFERLNEERASVISKLYGLSRSASEIRRKYAKKLEGDVMRELTGLGFKKADFSVSFADFPAKDDFEDKLTSGGADDIEFLLSPNPGQPLLPLVKIISGGEMSRFMLALKVVASKTDVATMIFDEIDAGISGITGREVAKKLAEISRLSQVICVTHLPQIASMADRQFYIEKSSLEDTTVTEVRLLDREGMIEEISRLSGTGGVSSLATKNAEELKTWADEFKRNLRN